MAISSPADSYLPSTSTASAFTLQNDHSLFTILRKNIYSDVTLAGIRELSTNAVDACLEAGMDVAWEAHIPTLEEPFFSVRDFGPGMTIDFLEGDFTVVGASSKRNSNLTNGQFGMGRLSPLAYTTSFTVESYNSGIHYSYLISLKDGIPSALQLSATPSNEPTGCRFSFYVEPTDIQSFHSKAANLYKYFSHKPVTNIKLPEVTIILDSDLLLLTNDSAGIVMANVYYPFDYKHISCNYGGLILKIPTGKVALTPGRESLSYDAATIQYLKDFIKDAEEELVDLSNAEIASQPTAFLKGKKYQELSSRTPYLSRDKVLVPQIPYFKASNYTPIAGDFCDFSFKTPSYKSLRTTNNSNHMWFYNAEILVADQRNFSHCLEDMGSNVLVVKPRGTENIQPTIDLLNTLGITHYKLASSFEVAERRISTRVRTPTLQLRTLGRSGVTTYSANMGTVYYIPYNGTDPKVAVDENNLLRFFHHLGYTQTVYGIPASNMPKIKDNPLFIDLLEKVRTDFANQSLLVYRAPDKVISNLRRFNDDFCKNVIVAPLAPGTLQADFSFYLNLRTIQQSCPSFATLAPLQEFITLHDYELTPYLDTEKITTHYPLLDEISMYRKSSIDHYLALEHVYELHKTSG